MWQHACDVKEDHKSKFEQETLTREGKIIASLTKKQK